MSSKTTDLRKSNGNVAFSEVNHLADCTYTAPPFRNGMNLMVIVKHIRKMCNDTKNVVFKKRRESLFL